jgi:signal transduction histidine kinase
VHPDIAGRAGIHHAMQVLVGRYREDFAGTIRWNGDTSARPSRNTATAMCRIANLALDNAVKHGSATLIEVILSPAAEGLRLEIKDNGTGFDANAIGPMSGLGLPLMRYYADRAGLALAIRSAPGAGCEIRVTSPGQRTPGAKGPKTTALS